MRTSPLFVKSVKMLKSAPHLPSRRPTLRIEIVRLPSLFRRLKQKLMAGWWFQPTPLKNTSQLGSLVFASWHFDATWVTLVGLSRVNFTDMDFGTESFFGW